MRRLNKKLKPFGLALVSSYSEDGQFILETHLHK